MQRFQMFIFLFVLFSCNGLDSNIEGEYANPENAKISLLRYGSIVTDAKLRLERDGTYVFSTCSQISEGLWKKVESKLILTCTNQKYITDSLNNIEKYAKGKICYSPMIFEISKKKLHLITPGKDSNYTLILIKD